MNAFIISIIIVKFVFITLTIAHRLDKQNDTISLYKNKTEFLYMALMAILLVYTFNPCTNLTVTKESKRLFFVMGILLLVTADWRDFYRPQEPQPVFAA
jgi:hypothetical protein